MFGFFLHLWEYYQERKKERMDYVTCHDDRRKRASHSKRYYSRIEKEIVYKERCHPLRNGIHRSYSVGFVFVHLKKDLVELFLLLLGFCREELIASKRNIFLSAVLLTV